MISRAGCVRALVVTAATIAVPLLWEAELVGGGKHDPQITNRTVRVTPTAAEVEVADLMTVEFGDDADRRELPRVISNALGVPTRARGYPSVFDGAFQLSELPIDDQGESSVVTLRGNGPGTPVSPLLVFTLPAAPEVGDTFEYQVISSGGALDAHDVTVYVQGVDLAGPTCRRTSGESCELTRVGEHYEAHLSSLAADDALTIGGTITSMFEATEQLAFPDDAEPRVPMEAQSRWTFATFLSLLGVAVGSVAGAGHVTNRRSRRRLASMAVPVDEQHPAERPSELPPIEPWMATALWEEQLDLRTLRSWLAQQVAADVLRVDSENNSRLAGGERIADADLGMAGELHRLMGPDGIAPMAPSLRIERMLRAAGHRQRAALQSQLWWRRFGPGAGHWFSLQLATFLVGWAGIIVALIETRWSHSWPVTIALLVLVPGTVAVAARSFTAPKPTPLGSETAAELIRVRAFFHAVTVPDVEQLWRDGRLTEFCVWAVAMGAADRWYLMAKASDIPDDERFALTAPLALGRTSGSWILTAA